MATARLHVGNAVRELPLSAATSVLNALVKDGVSIRHLCGGKARCGTCRVIVLGEREGPGLSPLGDEERLRLEAVGAGGAERLACRLYAARDIELRVPDRAGEG